MPVPVDTGKLYKVPYGNYYNFMQYPDGANILIYRLQYDNNKIAPINIVCNIL